MRMRPGSALLLVLLIATACGPLLVARGDGSSGDDDIIIGDGDDDSAVGDDDDDAGDDDSDPDPIPVVTDIYPAPDASDFFYQSNLWVEFNFAPQSAAVTLATSGGQALEGTTTESSSGRVVTFDPDDDLIPDTSYVMTVTWNSDDSPQAVSFSTGDFGEVLSDPDELVGRAYLLDLASATFVEPPGVGPILQSQMGDLEMAFTLTADSDLKSGEAHVLGALMEQNGGGVPNQDLCEETIAFTAGPDGVVGTADDQLGSFENPQLNFGPSTVTLSVQGLEVIYEEFSVTGTYHPDLSGTAGGTMAGTIDTRPLAPELDPEGGEEALCELVVETVGVECEACASDGQPFCLSVAAVNLTSSFVEGMVLQERGCADIIADYVASGETCVDKATGYDEDADENGTMDGTYPLCPSWTPEPGRSSP